MAERNRSSRGSMTADKATTRSRSSGSTQQARGRGQAQHRSQEQQTSQNSLSASDVVSRAREALSELIGRPVEGVLGIERDHGDWVATVQVLELARVPNTTDVLGDYETVLDSKGEVVRYHRLRRYHRGQVDGNQS